MGAVLAWLDSHWQARDVALLLDETKQWRRVHYQPSDAAVFAQLVLRCPRCGWTGTVDSDLRHCRKCSTELMQVEIFGNQEASFTLDADKRLVEIQSGGWNHDHCLICDLAIGRDSPWGYRESSFAGGPNSVGLWICEQCFTRFVSSRDFSFLVRER
jgi:hypothetical protein